MAYVKSISDIEDNAFALLDVAHGDGPFREVAIKLIKGSFVYYPIHYRDFLAFVPSKFIGYRDNTVERHDDVKRAEKRDGRDTNVAVGRILGKSTADAELESKLEAYCRSLGVEAEAKKHSFWRIQAGKRFVAPAGSAINDIQPVEVENDDPEYKRRMSGSYVRDNKVRKAVLRRANGNCEYGSVQSPKSRCITFLRRDGTPYLEAHHVIELSEQGRDKETNVIALCANHHREAHFGKAWKSLQAEFLQIISVKLGE